MKIFAKPGYNDFVVDFTESPAAPVGYIEVSSEPPTPDHILTMNGEWVLSDKKLKEQWKAARQAKVNAIVVNIDGLTFDGDETSQARMARAAALAETPTEKVRWILADNTVADVTADQLKRAARAAGREQEKLWIPPPEHNPPPDDISDS
ncbi:DUF4376 domain-containing protein [Endozoicomonas sp. YOMI1]|uniref:DUF4376 domain-containing protein n=1 Tax=Endozoicomonas sp. YOMI1 TaxID=2828739 RepID=UPI002147246B|nr:DUF4376 domain-containing protein [Endozoicomonas sp. YOMI1]